MNNTDKKLFVEQWNKLLKDNKINILWADGMYTKEPYREMIIDRNGELVLISRPEENLE